MPEIHDFILGEETFIKEQCGLFNNIEGIPSLSTFYRLSKYIDKDKLKDIFYKRIQDFISIVEKKENIIMNVDGKFIGGTLCGQKDRPLNILTPFCNNLKLPAMAIPCPDKQSEIRGWKKLLKIFKIINEPT